MKVNVITRHAPANYGSILQTIATQKIIENLGLECEIINYIPFFEKKYKIALTQLKTKNNLNNPIKRISYLLVRECENILMYNKFEKMRKQFLNVGQPFFTNEELRDAYENIIDDVFMTGSDQVWGPISNGKYDEAYFLNFVNIKAKKIAFASSFGKVKFSKEIIECYTTFLNNYDAIAVRENSAVDIINEMGIKAEQVLDPTLILFQDEWEKTINIPENKDGEYILIYQIHNDKTLNEYAKKISKISNLKLIRVSPILHQFKRGGKFRYLPDLGEFLSLIKHAKYLITDSFHGTAFAINFNTQFIEILPNTGTSTRNQSILKLTGLENRIVHSIDDFSVLERKINYEKVNEIIQKERDYSINILKNLLEIKDIK